MSDHDEQQPRRWRLAYGQRGMIVIEKGPEMPLPMDVVEDTEAALAAREEPPSDEKQAIEHYKRQRDENAGVAEGLAERVHRELGDYAAYLAAMEELTTEDYELPTREDPERPDAWNWGVRFLDGTISGCASEEFARNRAQGTASLVRRRLGEWQPVRDTEQEPER